MAVAKRPAKRRGIGEIVTRRRQDGVVVREYYRRDEVVAPTKEDADAGTQRDR
jgi:hypothetical protein